MPDEKEKTEKTEKNEINNKNETNNEDEKYIDLYIESLGFERKE